MKKNIFVLLAIFSSVSVAYAQKDTTLSRTVVVENNYNPEIMDASKVNVLPRVEELKAPKKNIEYIMGATPYSAFVNDKSELQIVESGQNQAKRGYVRAGLGNYGNTDFQANYLIDASQRDRVLLDAGLYGMKGKLKDWNERDWNARFYTSHFKAGYMHHFNDYQLNIGARMESQVYNYNVAEGGDKQHNTIADVNASISSTTDKHPLQFIVGVGFNYFKQKYALGTIANGSQKNFRLNGDVWAKLSHESRFGIRFDLDNFSYSSDNMKSYTAFRGNPYYAIENDEWRVRIGAHADYQTAVEKGVEFAPDVMAQYTISDGYVLYGKADGGVEINDFNRLNSLSPYFILNSQYASTSVPLDGKVGFKASPMNEMWFHIFAGYKIIKNDMSCIIAAKPVYTRFYQDKANALYASGEFRYSFKDIFDINMKGVYYSWSSKAGNEDLFLALKPELTLDLDLKYRVMPNLYLTAGYNYVKRVDNAKDVQSEYRLSYGNISNLYVGGEYELFKDITIYAKLNNILGSDNFRADCYPTEKFNFVGGLSFRF